MVDRRAYLAKHARMLLFRPANIADADVLFAWRNDPLTRRMSRCPEPVRFEEHRLWLEKRLAMTAPNLFVGEHFGRAVCTFRIDGDEISYTVAPEQRNKGYAKAMLRAARKRFGVLRAEIYSHNTASIRAAEAAGMTIRLLNYCTPSADPIAGARCGAVSP